MQYISPLIGECLICKRKLKIKRAISSNTFGVRIRTDGRFWDPMMLTQQVFLKCPVGKHTFWREDIKYNLEKDEYWLKNVSNAKNFNSVKDPYQPFIKGFAKGY